VAFLFFFCLRKAAKRNTHFQLHQAVEVDWIYQIPAWGLLPHKLILNNGGEIKRTEHFKNNTAMGSCSKHWPRTSKH